MTKEELSENYREVFMIAYDNWDAIPDKNSDAAKAAFNQMKQFGDLVNTRDLEELHSEKELEILERKHKLDMELEEMKAREAKKDRTWEVVKTAGTVAGTVYATKTGVNALEKFCKYEENNFASRDSTKNALKIVCESLSTIIKKLLR